MKFAIIVSRFNQSITQKLLEGALSAFKKHKIQQKEISVYWVPGAFEIPYLASRLAEKKKFNAIICLGCILKGETAHNEYISQAVANGIMQISISSKIPITFGILTPDNLKQAQERSGKGSSNKGVEAAEAAILMTEIQWD
ncbi:MAG: 6,7-dimethyl-8-ribityllumazine synthase [Elusimicrobia bacterium]|nr:6,7-dimethyl-8-ribityllumazine synthase [Elusimicrobiota bacterium]